MFFNKGTGILMPVLFFFNIIIVSSTEKGEKYYFYQWKYGLDLGDDA
jgi:hypothetical protein